MECEHCPTVTGSADGRTATVRSSEGKRPLTPVSLCSALGESTSCQHHHYHHHLHLHHLTVQLHWRALQSPFPLSHCCYLFTFYVQLSHLPQCLLGITVFDVHISTVFCQAADADPAAQLPAVRISDGYEPTTSTWMLYACNWSLLLLMV